MRTPKGGIFLYNNYRIQLVFECFFFFLCDLVFSFLVCFCFFLCSLSSRGEPVSSVVVRCFTEALPENRYLILTGYIST